MTSPSIEADIRLVVDAFELMELENILGDALTKTDEGDLEPGRSREPGLVEVLVLVSALASPALAAFLAWRASRKRDDSDEEVVEFRSPDGTVYKYRRTVRSSEQGALPQEVIDSLRPQDRDALKKLGYNL